MIREADLDHDGRLNPEEFAHVVEQVRVAAAAAALVGRCYDALPPLVHDASCRITVCRLHFPQHIAVQLLAAY